MDAGVVVDEVFLENEAFAARRRDPALKADADRVAAFLERRDAADGVFRVTREVFDKLAFGNRKDGIVAVCREPNTDFDGWLPRECGEPPLIVVLEGVEKPGNIGAVLRTADGAGASDCLLADPKTDVYNPNAIRASLGTIFSFRPRTASAGRIVERLLESNIAVFAARVEGACDYDAVDLTGPCAIVLGSEADGLTDVWGHEKIRAVRIPMLGQADSLNVAAAAAVLLYEARRQRRMSGSQR